MNKPNLVGLHVHSERSFLDGYSSLEDIAKRAKSLGQEAVALTDHAEVGGHYEFAKQCKEYGVKPLFGCEGYLVDDVTRVRNEKDRKNSHITLIAKNQKGLENLWAWSSEAYEKNFYYRALQDWDGAKKYSEGLYASDGCLLSYMAKSIIDEDTDRQHQLMGQYLKTFGENFYMELHTFQFMNPSTEEQFRLNKEMTMVNQAKVELAHQYSVPLVVVNDAHYSKPEDWVNHDLVWAMNTRGNADQTGEGQTATWMMDNEDALYWMSKHGVSRSVTEEAIKNTALIAESCTAEIKEGYHLPRLTKSDKDDLKLFMKHVEEGFQRKVIEKGLDERKYQATLDYELETIVSKGFPGYFLVVADYAKWAKEEAKMLMGPARGSAGGSLTSYLLDITEIDPVKYNLSFDRFLNPDRGDTVQKITTEDGRVLELKGSEEVMVSPCGSDSACGMKKVRDLEVGEEFELVGEEE